MNFYSEHEDFICIDSHDFKISFSFGSEMSETFTRNNHITAKLYLYSAFQNARLRNGGRTTTLFPPWIWEMFRKSCSLVRCHRLQKGGYIGLSAFHFDTNARSSQDDKFSLSTTPDLYILPIKNKIICQSVHSPGSLSHCPYSSQYL